MGSVPVVGSHGTKALGLTCNLGKAAPGALIGGACSAYRVELLELDESLGEQDEEGVAICCCSVRYLAVHSVVNCWITDDAGLITMLGAIAAASTSVPAL